MLRTVTINILLLLCRTLSAAAVGTVTASCEQQNLQGAVDTTTPSLNLGEPSSCARCEGPWQTQFIPLLRANLWHQLSDERRTSPLRTFTKLTDAELGVRMREMLIPEELEGDNQLLRFWANFEVVQREETRLFHDHFQKNLSSLITYFVFREMRTILYNRTLSEYEKCANIISILRAHDESCRELRQQQPYSIQVMTQRPFGPIAPSFILASVEEVERARAVDIWLNATTRFHAPLREMTAIFTAWQHRQSISVSATFDALLHGSAVWARPLIKTAKLLASSKDKDVLDRTLAIFLFDGDETGAQVCRKLFDLLAQLDEHVTVYKIIATLRYITARCNGSSVDSGSSVDASDSDDDGGARRFLRAHFLHGVSRFQSALSFETLLTLNHYFRDERGFLDTRKI